MSQSKFISPYVLPVFELLFAQDTYHFLKQSLGTPAYMAPEVVTKAAHTTASDIWSFGAIRNPIDNYLGCLSFNELFTVCGATFGVENE